MFKFFWIVSATLSTIEENVCSQDKICPYKTVYDGSQNALDGKKGNTTSTKLIVRCAVPLNTANPTKICPFTIYGDMSGDIKIEGNHDSDKGKNYNAKNAILEDDTESHDSSSSVRNIDQAVEPLYRCCFLCLASFFAAIFD